MIHFLITVYDEEIDPDPADIEAQLKEFLSEWAPRQVDVRYLAEPQRGVIKSSLRYYGRKQDKNRVDLIRKGRPHPEVDERISNIDDAYDVVGWDDPETDGPAGDMWHHSIKPF